MRIAQELAGFSITEADDLRKAIGKKIRSLMDSLKDQFMNGAAEQNVTPAAAKQLWEDVEKAADYSFPKAHAACYALIAYQTAWLRQNHPCEYMAALISSVMSTKDRVPIYVNACHELGIEVLPPDVNESMVDFAVVDGKIRFGLNAVKGVGEGAAKALIAARNEGGPFESIWDFTERVDPMVSNKRVLEALVKCGALPGSRKGMLEVLEQAVGWGQKQQSDRLAGQGSIFDLGPGGRGKAEAPPGDADRRVREERPAEAREGSARPLRLRASALGDPRPAAAQVRRDDRRARAAPRRRGDHRRRHRLRRAPHDDEARRRDGVPAVRGRHRQRRDGRLQPDLREGARALHDRPHPDREGPHRPQGRRDEARRARARARSRRSPRSARCG